MGGSCGATGRTAAWSRRGQVFRRGLWSFQRPL